VFLSDSLIAWKTTKQIVVSYSCAEAELRAIASMTAKVTWLRWLPEDFGVSLLSDNTGAISIARDPMKHELTKHIGVDASFVRTDARSSMCLPRYVPSELQLAGFFMKAQTRA
jgi:hypothetical protein